MEATLAELQRDAARVLVPVHAGQAVVLTEHGEPMAEIRRRLPVVVVTPEELRGARVSDQAILEAIDEARE